MRTSLSVIFVSLLTLVIGAGIYLYGFAGLGEYLRMNSAVNKLPEEQKINVVAQVRGINERGGESGILAGNWKGKVWVWRVGGLKAYTVDEFSIYSIFDGCREDIRARLNKGASDAIERQVVTSFDDWRAKAKAGEYMVVYPTVPDQGGVVGNLREIYIYNFWDFLPRGIDIKCAK